MMKKNMNNKKRKTTFHPSTLISLSFCFLIFLLVEAGVVAAADDNNNNDGTNTTPTTTLGDGKSFPLVGMGVGNLQHDLIVSQIVNGIEGKITDTENENNTNEEHKKHSMHFRLIDTAHASQNEGLVHNGIIQGLEKSNEDNKSTTDDDNVVHVITKIWYTYLGYERTKMSVEQSLEQLTVSSSGESTSRDIRVHVMLHWPRCMDNIQWMNCEEEENNLPTTVQELGDPIPHLHKDTAFLESWRALEDIYLGRVSFGSGTNNKSPTVASIGVSNFDNNDLSVLLNRARVVPHILQGQVWSYVFDPYLMDLIHKNGIHFQAYNVMNGIIGEQSQKKTPLAYSFLLRIANEMSLSHGKNTTKYTPAQVVLKWLVQNDVSVIPRTRQLIHLQENSPYAIGEMAHINKDTEANIIFAVKSLLKGVDLSQPIATFTNAATGGNEQAADVGEEGDNSNNDNTHLMKIYWKNTANGNENVLLKELLPGESFETRTWHDHTFVASLHEVEGAEKKERGVRGNIDTNPAVKTEEFKVRADFGGTDHFELDEF